MLRRSVELALLLSSLIGALASAGQVLATGWTPGTFDGGVRIEISRGISGRLSLSLHEIGFAGSKLVFKGYATAQKSGSDDQVILTAVNRKQSITILVGRDRVKQTVSYVSQNERSEEQVIVMPIDELRSEASFAEFLEQTLGAPRSVPAVLFHSIKACAGRLLS